MDKKAFIKQILLIFAFLVLILFLTMTWLRYYTNHGQKIEMPDYEETYLRDAQIDAEEKTFEIVIDDSVHIVNKAGGIIINQNPKAGAMVKEDRKLYVTITKYSPDTWDFDDLPPLYGNDYDQKRRELAYMEINTNVKKYQYDPGEPNHILEVWYNNEIMSSRNIQRKDIKIEKGGTLEFVLSEQSGGSTIIPDLSCYTVAGARFYLSEAKLKLGKIEGGDLNGDDFYIISQSPAYVPGETIERGTPINVTVQEQKPENCN